MKSISRLIIFLVTLAVICAGFSVYQYSATQGFLQHSVWTKGTVIGFTAHNDFEGMSYTTKVAYADRQGKQYMIETTFNASEPGYEVADIVDVIFNPNNPAEAKVATFWELYLWTFLSGIASSAALISAIVLYFVILRKVTSN
ncbi:MAG: DUF3592 domain-containing protein [Candidatus Abawacabacteria bacterium]|nr:DUF3592 domain-containing protein [Candidatus Abawacabacteria bacterium]